MYVCLCRAVTDEEIKTAIQAGNDCLPALQSNLGVAQQCGKCLCEVEALLEEYGTSVKPATQNAAPPLITDAS